MRRISMSALLIFFMTSGVAVSGCSKAFWGGAAAGAVGTGAVYEYKKKQQMDKLEAQRAAGEISQDEYQKRKAEIEKGSIIY